MNKNKPVLQADKNREKIKQQRERQNYKKEKQIEFYSPEEIVHELKKKGLPVFGTNVEKKDRLRKAWALKGLQGESVSNNIEPAFARQPSVKDKGVVAKKSNVVNKIEELKMARDNRRKKMEEEKKCKLEREIANEAVGKMGDVEFEMMIEKYKKHEEKPMINHLSPEGFKITVCVRKRPIFKNEYTKGEIDSVSCSNPRIVVHNCNFKVDGITKYLENSNFLFDNTFHEKEETIDLYNYSIRPLIKLLFTKGVVTIFAYGQTGSGKTFTMLGVQKHGIEDMFSIAKKYYTEYLLSFHTSFYEIYGGRVFDLLNNRKQVQLMEDRNQKIQIQGLTSHEVNSAAELIECMEYGHSVRTTHSTTSNDTSSRSHAICQIIIKQNSGSSSRTIGKLTLVDLAGSERAQDCQSNNRQRRLEGAEINKSLLSLKECIRALDESKGGAHIHVPFRASKLTMVLRDSFMGKTERVKIVMIACVSPGNTSADHTINTLRYADRLKEQKGGVKSDQEYQAAVERQAELFRKESKQIENKQQEEKKRFHNEVETGPNNFKPKIGQERVPQPGKIQKKGLKAGNDLEIKKKEGELEARPPKVPLGNNDGNKAKDRKKWENVHNGQKNRMANPHFNFKNNHHNQNKGLMRNQLDPPQIKEIPMKENIIHSNSQSSSSSASLNEERDQYQLEEAARSQEKIKEKAEEDWQYLKQTIHEKEGKVISKELLLFQEKADMIMDEEEELIKTHMSYIKEDAQLLTQEGQLISNLQGNVDYDIDEYVQRMEKVVKRKLELYTNLYDKIKIFKKHLKEEEDAHHNVTGAFFF